MEIKDNGFYIDGKFIAFTEEKAIEKCGDDLKLLLYLYKKCIDIYLGYN